MKPGIYAPGATSAAPEPACSDLDARSGGIDIDPELDATADPASDSLWTDFYKVVRTVVTDPVVDEVGEDAVVGAFCL
ncbi:hypothetical protein [Actinospica robiniae]|uniref:hypothetical protein n=1 Tax=Actinospica robiniae TaxID=304901 RepID=UPI00041813F4|nr:hypothetical protein [Actinospica robiniae]